MFFLHIFLNFTAFEAEVLRFNDKYFWVKQHILINWGSASASLHVERGQHGRPIYLKVKLAKIQQSLFVNVQTFLHVTSHSEISTGRTAVSGKPTANMSCPKTLFLVNSVYTNNVHFH